MHAAQKKSLLHRPKTFAERIRVVDGWTLHVIRTYDHEKKPCWFLLRSNELSMAKLERTAYGNMIDLTTFGEVVASGWGHTLDEHMIT